ncbi:hypothetical protein KP509_32G010300 [Ceratopteris richardii]|uniref:MaoC-like domain-containing protein n=1 Tax=Ceratopteris richardii TaxID=49495 RepID=A0A8T2QRB3_CERRI|nr:hypothetical protein KP509_32G010300 [Ceratopteris richardii]
MRPLRLAARLRSPHERSLFASWTSTTESEVAVAASVSQAEGEVLKKEHIFAQEELSAYSILSGDSNPIHTVPSAAAAHGFSACVVHGMLCATLFSSLISSRFPGSVTESKNLRFKEPALVGDRLEAIAKVLRTRVAKDSLSVDLKLECYKKETGGLVLEGSSTIIVPSKGHNVLQKFTDSEIPPTSEAL